MNALGQEKSPYLLQHADNPVDWLPWGEAAFRRAREEDQLIFLSVGYSTCHWCHVMAHESFEDPVTAALLNHHFINVKVDREERPDVDLTYLTFIQATSGGGGWPMSVWLTPELTPVLGGTYFPPEDGVGRAGFKTVIKRIAESWQSKPAELRAQADKLIDHLQAFTDDKTNPASSGVPDPPSDIFANAYDQAAQRFEPHRGGFSQSPKFPRPSVLHLLQRLALRLPGDRARHAREMVESTLYGMALGGIRDHLGGGFHRYSVDTYWHVPHFEKMLYDQAQIAISYLEAYQTTSRPRFAQVARETCDYVLRDLVHPGGAFYSAEDADSPDGDTALPQSAEGAFYVWEESEIDRVLGGEISPVFKAAYGIKPEGNARRESDPHGELKNKNIFYEALSEPEIAQKFDVSRNRVADCLNEAKRLLFEARQTRPRPHLDDKIVTAWNGLMISALAKAARILREPAYLDAAQKAAAFLKSHLVSSDGTLLRSHRGIPSEVTAFAADYAFLIQALLDLFETDFDPAHLEWAEVLQNQFDTRHGDTENGGYFSVQKSPTSVLSIKEDYDGAEPAPNSIAALNLLRLGDMLDRPAWTAAAEKILTLSQKALADRPYSAPQLAVAFDFANAETTHFTLTPGEGEDDLKDILHTTFLPHANFKSEPASGAKSTVQICRGRTCQLPISDPEKLVATIRELNPTATP